MMKTGTALNVSMINRALMAFSISLLLFSCGSDQKNSEEKPVEPPKTLVSTPNFNEDSAYIYVEKQVGMGTRVPNTPPHAATAKYLKEKLEGFGAITSIQEFEATAYDGSTLYLKNIIASINPEANKRILLAAHWDTRPFADKDPERPNDPIDGANDGASGVGVLLEVARAIQSQPLTNIGVDIILFDGEDHAEPMGYNGPFPTGAPGPNKSYWCLGSQYWSQNKHQPSYAAYYGILLDMVGARGSQFHLEGTSMQYAPKVMKKVWDIGNQIGFSNYFIYQNQGGITDDHLFVNEMGKIPMIDIVHYDPVHGYFGDYHHSHKDNMDVIDKATLKAVGQTLLQVLYNEQ